MSEDPITHFLAQVRACIERYGLLEPGEHILVAVSGGADSLALLYALRALAPERSLRLTIAHLNHRLRPEADADARFVAALGERLAIPSVVEAVDVRAARRGTGLSLEQAARRERYRFFARAAAQAGAGKVATAHTADDDVETLLINLLRGAGIEGLSGIPPIRPLAAAENALGAPAPGAAGPEPGGRPAGAPVLVIRPLIDLWRADVEAYGRALGLEPREDLSNRSREFLRNRVRLDVLPAIVAAAGPAAKESIHRLARVARPEAEFMARAAEQALGEVARPVPGGIALRVEALNSLHLALRRRAVRLALGRLGVPPNRAGLEQVERVLDAAARPGDARFDLPGRVRVRKRAGEVTLLRDTSSPAPAPPAGPAPLPFEAPLPVPGQAPAPGGGSIEAREAPRPAGFEAPRAPRARQAFLDADAVRPPLVVRSRRPGDRFIPLGMAGRKALRRLFIDARVPAAERDHVPVVSDQEGILWVAGLAIAGRARVTPATTRLLRLSWLSAEEEGAGGPGGE